MKISTGMVNPVQISSTAHGHGGKVTLPVSPVDTMYAQYKYVQGIPASTSQSSVPLKRLQLLNNMIVSLQNLNKIATEQQSGLNIEDEIQSSDLSHLGQMIHDKLREMPPAFTAVTNTAATTGMAFNLAI
ncbi:MAG: hypothetical protein PQJ59_07290 [Spirochaetales bacterium]|nr:hypothetical protein [Spirochaetales bacterium]